MRTRPISTRTTLIMATAVLLIPLIVLMADPRRDSRSIAEPPIAVEHGADNVFGHAPTPAAMEFAPEAR